MLLDIRNLTKRFGGLTAVSNVSFGIERGEIIGIFGPNGSGKTTTLSLIAGILVPTDGSIVWKGKDISAVPPFEVAQHGLVKTFQNPQLFPELTVAQHMRIACHLHIKRALGFGRVWSLFGGMPAELNGTLTRKIDQMLELCRLADKRNEEAGALSYGGEKMLGVAMGMVCEPELLLLDEPASGLGHDEIMNLDAVLRDLRTHGVTLCIIDHKVGFLGRLADRSIALHHGAVIATGKTADVLANEAVIEAYLGKKHA
ncbi:MULTISPECIES: ABC transporter ATP-binding protein [unclassified Bradyrhizobium]|uniref:ABC transporter ATP-binding protein n=1 Tax=unclassified Bradyrhizobium TaxID=2631580 RepID=UPI00102E80AD|nr:MULTISPECIES: ABC transporter ATP-binding protein [unclassified Bradyrhizobium]MDI4233266.1 ABC transporter ATP-binding protein [Bradyrhizobium sp. Arg237L]TAI67946.1 ABC transporter ATP-binding protein [Bradyrhizobium sp. Leo170]